MEKRKRSSINFRKRKVVNWYDFSIIIFLKIKILNQNHLSLIFSSKTNWHVFLTKPNSNRRNFESSISQSFTLTLKSCWDVVDISGNWDVAAPEFFSKSTCSDPYFSLNVVRISDFTPHTNFSTNHVDSLDFSCETCV